MLLPWPAVTQTSIRRNKCVAAAAAFSNPAMVVCQSESEWDREGGRGEGELNTWHILEAPPSHLFFLLPTVDQLNAFKLAFLYAWISSGDYVLCDQII